MPRNLRSTSESGQRRLSVNISGINRGNATLIASLSPSLVSVFDTRGRGAIDTLSCLRVAGQREHLRSL